VGSLSPQGICLERVFFVSHGFLQAFMRCTLAGHKTAHPEKIVSRMSYLWIPHSKLLDIIRGFWSESPPAESWTKSGETTEHNESSSQTDMGFGLPAIMI
jgi:hypothetical protein